MAHAGDLFIRSALALSVLSLLGYVWGVSGAARALRAARAAQNLSVAAVAAAALSLLWLLVTDSFAVKYVHDFSARDQKLIYKISAFWGGQEGSWLLWLLWISLAGTLLGRRMQQAQAPAMAFWMSLQTFFLTIASISTPFRLSGSPLDGTGLNPLLQNYWMAIHPPILFAGFTLSCVPAAFAVSALVRGDILLWSRAVFGWALAAWTTLGVGLLLGGIWAYETLGWGGFWGWDPVENSSLVPWLVSGAVVHGLLLERSKPSLGKLNLVSALAAFLLVIYATFLTRSGVLGDFSVHSFAALADSNWLLGFLIAYTAAAAALLALRTRRTCDHAVDDSINISSKDILVFCGIVLFGLAALLVALGMSSPLISGILNGRPGNVPVLYYYRVMTPLTLVLILIIGYSPLVNWGGGTSGWRPAVALAAALSAALALSLTAFALGGLVQGARYAVMSLAAVAAVPNLWALVRSIRARGILLSGGHLSHLGFTLFLVGIIISSWNNKTPPDRLTLKTGSQAAKLGMQWKLNRIDASSEPGKQKIELIVSRGSRSFRMRPEIRQVRDGSMLQPSIRRSISGDLYVAPVAIGAENLPPHASIAQGSQTRLGSYLVRFDGFTPMQQLKSGQLRVGARLSVRLGTGRWVPLTAYVTTGGESLTFSPAKVPGSADQLGVATMDVTSRTVTAVLDGPSWRKAMAETATVEVTMKPLVWLVWLGATMIALGGGISTVRRSREAANIGVSIPEQIEQISGHSRVSSVDDSAPPVQKT